MSCSKERFFFDSECHLSPNELVTYESHLAAISVEQSVPPVCQLRGTKILYNLVGKYQEEIPTKLKIFVLFIQGTFLRNNPKIG